MDYMRQGIGLRGYAQKDPLVEYRTEGEMMFDEMSFLVKQETVRALMHVEVEVEDEAGSSAHSPHRQAPSCACTTSTPTPRRWRRWRLAGRPGDELIGALPVVEQRQVDPDLPGRNDPCWCGRGKKFKRCHGA